MPVRRSRSFDTNLLLLLLLFVGVALGCGDPSDEGGSNGGGSGGSGGVGATGGDGSGGGGGIDTPCVIEHDVTIRSDQDAAQLEDGCGKIRGSLTITGAVTDLSALRSVTAIEGSLEVQRTSLGDLRGLGALGRVDGDVSIFANEALGSLAGLDHLAEISGKLIISTNGALTSLRNLSELSVLSGGLTVTNNESLPKCDVDWLIAELGSGLGGFVISSRNNGVCTGR